jgi:hypothetical protein
MAEGLTRKKKLAIAGGLFGLLLLFLGYEAVRFWWFRGYSNGTRTGVVRKLSVKGPPYCKYFEGELVMQGLVPGQAPEIWTFSVDDEEATNPVVKALQDAEQGGARVTLRYRQDLHSMFRCTPNEYFVTGVEK